MDLNVFDNLTEEQTFGQKRVIISNDKS
jgi:hypothetical protein